MKELKPIGGYLKSKRGERNLSQAELAALVGVSRGYIAQLESNEQRYPSNKIIHALAKALRVPAYELFREAGMIQREIKVRSITSVLNQLKQALPVEVPVYDFVTNEIVGSAYAPKEGTPDGLEAFRCANVTADPGINDRGDCRPWPGCNAEDIVFVAADTEPHSGDIILLRQVDNMHFARWPYMGDEPVLGVVQSLMTKLK